VTGDLVTGDLVTGDLVTYARGQLEAAIALGRAAADGYQSGGIGGLADAAGAPAALIILALVMVASMIGGDS
jgi:hypothetical protein